jgi:DNA-binding transcriptional regulator LsrR (DeoR family)
VTDVPGTGYTYDANGDMIGRGQSRQVRNKKIGEAVENYGYTQREIADHLGLYFTSVSRIMRERADQMTIK